jgi:hypothetical protein
LAQAKSDFNMANTELDLCFLCDATGSMGSYIAAAQQNICAIATKVSVSECANVRFALVSYRDHPPQDSSYVTRVFPFTPDVAEMQQYVSTMSASGGGDGPEAVTAALDDALNLPWRPNATKVAVLIADAPPHGLEPTGDGFPNGDPEGRDPLEIARRMAENAITVYAVGCEPALGGYRFARDFMCSLAEITGGQAIALSSADKLADVIINGSAEEISLTRLSREVEDEVERVRAAAPAMYAAMGEEEADDMVQQQAWSNLKSRGVMSKQMRHDGGMVYQAASVASVWKGAKSLSAAKEEVCEKGGHAIDAMDDAPRMRCAELSVRSARPGSKMKKAAPSARGVGLMGSMMPGAVRSLFGGSAPSADPDSMPPKPASMMPRSGLDRGMSLKKGGRMSRRFEEDEPMCASESTMESEPEIAMAPMEAKSVKSNVLVEDEISYDQVKRIMARKSKK